MSNLSGRQREVLRLIAVDGLSNKQMARRLNLSVGTIKVHVAAVFGKMQVHSRVALVIRATQMGAIEHV